MRELIDREPVGDRRQRAQHGEQVVANARLVLGGFLADDRPLLGRRLVHTCERLCHGPQATGSPQGAPSNSAAPSAKNSRPAPRGSSSVRSCSYVTAAPNGYIA